MMPHVWPLLSAAAALVVWLACGLDCCVAVCSGRRDLDLDDDVMLASSSPLKRTRSLGRLSRRWLARHGVSAKSTKPKDDGSR